MSESSVRLTCWSVYGLRDLTEHLLQVPWEMGCLVGFSIFSTFTAYYYWQQCEQEEERRQFQRYSDNFADSVARRVQRERARFTLNSKT